MSALLSNSLQAYLEYQFRTDRDIEELRGLILGVGSALIGAAAIVTSLVLFAMQVNIERMPHGLFRRLSEDRRLLAAFAVSFILAIGIATLSIFLKQPILAPVLLSACWAIALILLLFMYAYRRALILVNPVQQLRILILDARRDMRTWARRAQRAAPLLAGTIGDTSSTSDSGHDLARTAFFQVNGRWDDGAIRALRHSMSYARRYSEQGDYEVSGAAIGAVVGINSTYIEIKGRTFYGSSPLIDNPLATDRFINDTLEHLRRHAQSGITRRDEQQIEQTLQSMAALVGVYLGIDYSNEYASKSHAHLAAGYLASAVQAVVPYQMADVLMEGQRLLGRSAQLFLANTEPNDIAVLTEKIALVACTGCARDEYRPVTMEGMTQLANLTFSLLRMKRHDISHAADEVR